MRRILISFCLSFLCAAAGAEPALRAGIAESDPPFVMPAAKGEAPAGFTVALFQAIAARLHRGIEFTRAPMSVLAQDLADERLDFLAGPIPATPERSAEWLFTEGYVGTVYRFGVRPGLVLEGPEGLRGGRLAVQEGTDYAVWAAQHSGKLGFAATTYPTQEAVFAAVRQGAADASLTDDIALAYAASHGGGIVPSIDLPETKSEDGAAFRPADADLRDAVEDALVCLKRDGTVAKLAKTWMGTEPGPEDLENLEVPGYGVPGLTGYEPKARKPAC